MSNVEIANSSSPAYPGSFNSKYPIARAKAEPRSWMINQGNIHHEELANRT